MDRTTQVQILDEAICISHSTNTLEKTMDPIILPLVMGRLLFNFHTTIRQGK